MKILTQLSLFILMTLMFTHCSIDEDDITPNIEASILGEWKIEGFDNTRYHFTENELYRVYEGSDANFQWPTLAEWRAENPQLRGLDWHYEGDIVVIDLNFGHIQRLTPLFKCENKVIEWIQEDGTSGSKYYRVDHDFDSCN